MLALRVKQPWFLLHLRVFGHCRQRQNLLKGSRGISSWHRWGPKCPPGAFLGSQAANYQTGFPEVAASAKIQLLVDADSASIDVIRQGIGCLEKEGYEVHTVLFAPPGRETNWKWKRFMSEQCIHFHPVPRSRTYSNEPNDDAIVSAMRNSSLLVDVASLALLTSDAGFVGAAADVQSRGRPVVMLIPEGRLGVAKRYQASGLRVIKLDVTDAKPKVRAILHKDGSGSVRLAEAFDPLAHPPQVEDVETLLEDYGLKSGEGILVQKCAKYWFENHENHSGPLTVYPPHLAFIAVHDALKAKSQSGKACFNHLAYFLPVTGSGGKLGAQNRERFGSRLARQVWRAGGPFIKKDSPTLVAEVLQKLGYVDEVSVDLREPIFCFINMSQNKNLLRQTGMLPVFGDDISDSMRKLRAAFLSNLCSGMWQTNEAKSVSEMRQILHILRKALIVTQSDAANLSHDETFAAMKAYARREGLPLARDFDALALRIRHHNNRSPDLRQLIEIA